MWDEIIISIEKLFGVFMKIEYLKSRTRFCNKGFPTSFFDSVYIIAMKGVDKRWS